MQYIYIGADFDVWYEGAVLRAGGAFLNAGTCTWALRAAGGAVDLATGTLDYVSGSDGNYRGVIPAAETADLTEDADYDVRILFAGGGAADLRVLTFKARYRGRS